MSQNIKLKIKVMLFYKIKTIISRVCFSLETNIKVAFQFPVAVMVWQVNVLQVPIQMVLLKIQHVSATMVKVMELRITMKIMRFNKSKIFVIILKHRSLKPVNKTSERALSNYQGNQLFRFTIRIWNGTVKVDLVVLRRVLGLIGAPDNLILMRVVVITIPYLNRWAPSLSHQVQMCFILEKIQVKHMSM